MSQADADRLVTLLTGRAPLLEGLARVEWDALVFLAIQHDLAPWYYARLKAGSVHPPQAIAEQLREIYLASAARSMRLFHELGTILRAFQAAGIPVIPLKGACLAEAVYGDVALRPMADIDLLVEPDELPRAVSLLRTLGYNSDQPFDPAAEQTISQHMPMMARSGAATVEVHWTIVCPAFESRFATADLDGLWSRAVPATIAGVPALMLSPTDLLLHLCLHVSSQHRFDDLSLRSFVDMAVVCERYGERVDWNAFTARANQWGVANGVYLALVLAEEWTEFGCPTAVLTGLNADPLDDGTLSWVKHKVLNGSSLPLRSDFTRLETTTGVGGKLATLREVVFPARAVMARMYPAPANSWRILSFYPVRLKDLWVRYHQALWRMIWRDKPFIADARKEGRLREYLGWR